MNQSATKHEDRAEYPFARDAANSGRAIEVMSPVERSHPYNRRPSLPMLDGPRVHLPSLGHEGSTRSDAPRIMSGHSQPVNIPGISSLDMRDGPWQRSVDRERYWEDRNRQSDRPSDDRIPMSRTASTGHAPQMRLPSFHSLSSSEPHNGDPFGPGSSVMPPPPRPRTNPPSPQFAYARPTSPHLPAAHSLRPSYSSHSRPLDRRDMHDYSHVKRETSPPLRSIHNYEPQGYPSSSAGQYHHASDGRRPAYHHGHQQHHPASFTNRAQHHPSYADPSRRQEEERPAGPGQSRRLAHLMSEQKRRESINTGFVGLRQVVPSASITDSKAVILRKAAAHIKQLEAMLSNRQKGGRISSPEKGGRRTSSPEKGMSRYNDVSDDAEESMISSSSETRDVKMERDGSEDNDWRPSTRN